MQNEITQLKTSDHLSGLVDNLARCRAGFSLVELLTALCIVGILIAITVPAYNNYSNRTVTSGIVIDKIHADAHSATVMVYSGSVIVPITTHHPESWKLVIRGERGDGEFKNRRVNVPAGEYSKIRIGGAWQQ